MSTDSHHDRISIRAMSLAERAIWEELWTGYLDFYNTKISQETKSVTWARLHDPNEPMYLLAASLAGRSSASCITSTIARAGPLATIAISRICSWLQTHAAKALGQSSSNRSRKSRAPPARAGSIG